ncbi:hypothetical protein BC826DRAFT_1056154, partial [Russula brevipes]
MRGCASGPWEEGETRKAETGKEDEKKGRGTDRRNKEQPRGDRENVWGGRRIGKELGEDRKYEKKRLKESEEPASETEKRG